MPIPTLHVQELTLHAGALEIFIDDLRVEPGEMVSVVGRSGCGKTTLLSTIAGFMEPSHGRILIDAEPHSADGRRQRTALTHQRFPLLPWLTVRGNVELALRIRGMTSKRNVGDILKTYGADEFSDRYPHELAGGQRCRASLAQALVVEPALLLLDEPFAGLDFLTKNHICEYLDERRHNGNHAIVLVSHELLHCCQKSDRVVTLRTDDCLTTITGDVRADNDRPHETLAVVEQLLSEPEAPRNVLAVGNSPSRSMASF